MKISYLLAALTLLINVSCAQIPAAPSSDTTMSLPPNTIRLIATVKAVTKDAIKIRVIEITGTGQGIVNIISPGQEVDINPGDLKHNLRAGEKIESHIKEEMGVDASQSSYKLLNVRKRS